MTNQKTKMSVKKIILIIVLIILLAAVAYGAVLYNSLRLTGAEISSIEGDVEINQGLGWKQAEIGLTLNEGDQIKTGEGKAIIVFFDSSFSILQENSHVRISELNIEEGIIVLEQLEGKTWNKVVKRPMDKMAGITPSGAVEYKVVADDIVATVRGTSFGVDRENKFVAVNKGLVSVQANGFNNPTSEGFETHLIEGSLQEKELEIRKWIEDSLLLEENMRQVIKMKLFRKYGKIIKTVARKEGKPLTNDEVLGLIDDYIDGTITGKDIIPFAKKHNIE